MTSLDVDVYCRTVVQPVESWRADLEFRGTRRAGGGGGHGRSRWLRTSRQGPAQTPSPPASLTVLSLPCHCPFTDSQNRFCCRSYEVLETYVQSAVDREALVATAAAAYEAEGPLAWLRMYFDEVVWPVAEAQTRSAGCRCRCCCCPPPPWRPLVAAAAPTAQLSQPPPGPPGWWKRWPQPRPRRSFVWTAASRPERVRPLRPRRRRHRRLFLSLPPSRWSHPSWL